MKKEQKPERPYHERKHEALLPDDRQLEDAIDHEVRMRRLYSSREPFEAHSIEEEPCK